MKPVTTAAKAMIADMLSRGFTRGEMLITLSVAKKAIKKDRR
ncbi:hypothetical protein [Sporomusa sphaeroides]|nr:hypothetical protein [Sporomusa sphaeroides]